MFINNVFGVKTRVSVGTAQFKNQQHKNTSKIQQSPQTK